MYYSLNEKNDTKYIDKLITDLTKIGLEFNKSRSIRWDIHANLVTDWLQTIFLRRLSLDADEVEEMMKLSRLIGFAHDLLKCPPHSYLHWSDDSISTVDQSQKQVNADNNQDIVIELDEYHEILPYCLDVLQYIAAELGIDESGMKDEKKLSNQILLELIKSKSYHGLNAASFIYKYMKIDSLSVLVPVILHSCPVDALYNRLDDEMKMIVDCTVLADKCASNYLKVALGQPVHLFLHETLFGKDGTEFNFSSALLIARIIGQGKDPNKIQKDATKRYKRRCEDIGLFVPEKTKLKSLGDKHLIENGSVYKQALEGKYGTIENTAKPGGNDSKGSEGT